MKVLVLGGDGMLGHQLLRQLGVNHDVRVTLRQERAAYARFSMFTEGNAYCDVDVRDLDRLREIFEDFLPDVVINAVGVVKQRSDAKESIPSITINALFPHQLSIACRVAGARLVHLSTDCVFSGARGRYSEDDQPDAEDLYGRSKLLGEVTESHCITLRTSIVGLELKRKTGLIEWFLSQRGSVRGYTKAIYTGFTTAEMARIIEKVFAEHPSLSGVYHVSSEPITKFDLLRMVQRRFNLDIEITPYNEYRCDRSLDSTRFRRATGYNPPTWESMIAELEKEYRERYCDI